MDLSICIISNRMEKLERFIGSIPVDLFCDLCICTSHPLTEQEVKSRWPSAKVTSIEGHGSGYFNYCGARRRSIELASTEFILWADDDFIFHEGVVGLLHECIERDEDLIEMKSSLGAPQDGSGDYLLISRFTSSTSRGLLVKREKALDALTGVNFLGAGEDFVFVCAVIASGGVAYARFNCNCITKDATKVIEYKSPHKSYDKSFVMKSGAGKYIQDRWGLSWQFGGKLPISIWEGHRSNRKVDTPYREDMFKSQNNRQFFYHHPEAIITPAVKENPRRPGGHGYRSMELIIPGPISFKEFIQAGGRAKDLFWDIDYGHVSVNLGEEEIIFQKGGWHDQNLKKRNAKG